jgi:hypothetical protein
VGSIFTDVYITGYRNRFIKIRFSYPLDKQVESEKAIAPVLTALGKMMSSRVTAMEDLALSSGR